MEGTEKKFIIVLKAFWADKPGAYWYKDEGQKIEKSKVTWVNATK